MIVVDASAMIDALIVGPRSAAVMQRLRQEQTFAAPHLLDVEVAQVSRRLVRTGQLAPANALAALANLIALPITRYPHTRLIARAFAVRNNVTVYDGIYIALAEALKIPLITCDAKLAAVPGHRAMVEVL